MTFSPRALCAVVAVAIAGAASGAMIGDNPVLKRSHADTLPEAQFVTATDAALRSGQRPPDHYPLETPDGTIEVAELALHGRMRSRGGSMWWDGPADHRADTADLNAEYDFYATASPERIAHERRLLAFTEGPDRSYAQPEPGPEPEPQRPPTRAEAPMALAEPAAVTSSEQRSAAVTVTRTATIGNSKSISVADALATPN